MVDTSYQQKQPVGMKIAFDIGGVLSKYPDTFRPIITALEAGGIECHIITDTTTEGGSLKKMVTVKVTKRA